MERRPKYTIRQVPPTSAQVVCYDVLKPVLMAAVHTRRDTPRQAENEYVDGAFALSRSLVPRLGWSRSLVGFLRPSQRVSLSLARKTRASMYTLVQLVYR